MKRRKRNTARRKCNPRKRGGKSLSLRNFTGKVRLNPDKTVSVLGVGKRTAKKRKTSRKRRARR